MHPQLLSPVLRIIHRAINTFRIKQTNVKRIDTTTGAITLIQRFGSAANLNIHLQGLVLDGVYQTSGDDDDDAPVFHDAPAPSNQQLQALLDKIIRRILKLLTCPGHLIEDEGITYITRPAIANERLSVNREGNVVLKRKTPWRNGATHIILTPMEFMRRLAALAPRPRLHLIRFHGVLAPNAKLRSRVVPALAQRTTAGEGDCAHAHSAPVRMTWARLLKRESFDIDIERCACGGKLKLIAVIEEPAVIEKILTHLGLSAQPPPRVLARRVDLFEAA